MTDVRVRRGDTVAMSPCGPWECAGARCARPHAQTGTVLAVRRAGLGARGRACTTVADVAWGELDVGGTVWPAERGVVPVGALVIA